MEELLRATGFLLLGSFIGLLILDAPTSGLALGIFALVPIGLIILAPLIAVGVKVESRIVRYMAATVIGALATYLGYGIVAWLVP